MDKLGLSLVGAPAGLHAPRLERLAVAARGNLAVLALTRQPHLEVVRLRRAEADVAAAQRHDAIGEPEPLQHGLRIGHEQLELGVRLLGSRDVHELDLVELMLADHAARVLAVGAGLGPEARRVRHQPHRQREGGHDVPVGPDDQAGESDRQVSAMAEHVLTRLKEEEGLRPLGTEGLETGQWVLLDFGEVVVHLFFTETRAFYDLEGLWADAPRERVA